jgi:hypothetical protein
MGFWSLAALFRPVNSFFIALLNHEELAVQPAAEVLAYAETAINSAIKPTTQLHDSQKANLRVTQFWLKIILWQLRLHLGMLAEESFQRSLTFIYPIDVAKDLTLSTRDLSIGSFHVHGVGLAEKLFDIASALIDVLARIPRTDTSPESYATGTQPEDDLAYIRALINKLPGGRSTYNDLLNRHIAQAGIVQVSTPI